MPATPDIRRLAQLSVNAHDLERATSFYRDRLGLRFLFGAGNMAFFDLGGIRLMVAVASAPEHDHPGSILYLDVATSMPPTRHSGTRACRSSRSRTSSPHWRARTCGWHSSVTARATCSR